MEKILKQLTDKELSEMIDTIRNEQSIRRQRILDCKVQLPSHMADTCIECDYRLECFDRTDGTHVCYDVCAMTDDKQNCEICLCPCE